VRQASLELAVSICQAILNLLPSKEKYALTTQRRVRFKASLQILLKDMGVFIIKITYGFVTLRGAHLKKLSAIL
jgi:hypothetical protein